MMLKFFKLVVGDEILGEPLDGDEYDLRRIGRPIRMLLTREGCGLARIPVKSLTIDKAHILYEGEADEEMTADYAQYFARMEGRPDLVVPDKRIVRA